MRVQHPFAWSQGLVIERPRLLCSDGSLVLLTDGATEGSLREELRNENALETDPEQLTRFGVVRIEVLSAEDPRPPASRDVRHLLLRGRALPRIPETLKAEIGAALARTEP